MADHDLVVSLLPYAFHPRVGRCCLDHGRHLITASYVAPEMQALDTEARDKGLVFLNEIGLDPGIDHMSAMRIIDDVHARGGKIGVDHLPLVLRSGHLGIDRTAHVPFTPPAH